MADRKEFSVSLVTPDGAAYEGDAEMIIVPGAAGEIGVLARHAPLIATLKAGSTRVHVSRERGARVRDRAGLLPGAAGSCDRARRRRRQGGRRSTTVRAQRAARGRAEGARGDRVAASRRPTAGRSSSASATPRTSSRSSAARSAMRVAALPDVHGNARRSRPSWPRSAASGVDAIVFCGDLTWGPLPNETLELVHAITLPEVLRAGQRRPDGRAPTRASAASGWRRSTARRRRPSSTASRRTSSSTSMCSGRRASCTARRAATRSA